MKTHKEGACFQPITWSEILFYTNKIHQEISDFLKAKKTKIKYIIPILRGGGIPGMLLAYKFGISEILPIQIKHISKTKKISKKIDLSIFKNLHLKKDECILLVEGDYATGRTVQIACEMIRECFGAEAKIIFACLTQDFYHKFLLKDLYYSTAGAFTNKENKLSLEECKLLGIRYIKPPLYPWEKAQEEFIDLNTNWSI